MRRILFLVIAVSLICKIGFSQCVDCSSPCVTCEATVPEIEVDLSASIDTIFEIEDLEREGHCCGVAGGNSMNCIKFNITLNDYSEQFKFEMRRPAPPSNASKYWINCQDPMYNLGDDVCIVGKKKFCISYCKTGNDNPIYKFTVGRTTRASSDISLAAGCMDTIFVFGMVQSSINWTAVGPDALTIATYNSYLSGTLNDTILVTAPIPIPDGLEYIDYAVSGQAAGCTSGLSHDTVRVYFVQNTLSVVIDPQDPAICADGPGNIVLTAVGSGGTPPYSYVWSTGSSDSFIAVFAADIEGSGDFWVEISDTSDCGVRRDTVTVVEFSLPISVDAGQDMLVCYSNATDTLQGVVQTASGGIWSGGTDSGFLPDRTTLDAVYTLSAAEVAAGFVELVLTTTGNRGCGEKTDTVRIYVEQEPTLNFTKTDVSCNGGNTGSATITITGGTAKYNYSWSTGSSTNNSPSNSNTLNSLIAGNYCVTVVDSVSCTVSKCVTITEPAALSTSITAQTNVKCKGNSTGSATVTAAGGTPVYSYLWNSVPAQNTATASNLPAGIYTVTVTDANLCTSTVSATITEPAAILSTSITAQTNVKCKGNSTGSATVTAAGGTPVYSYLWNSVPAQNTATASNLPAGVYTVTVTDANLCTSTVSATITEPAAILSTSITAQTNVKCKGNSTGSATVTAAGGTPVYSYLWNSVPAQNTATASNLPAGVYTVTVTDANLCTSTVSATITEPAAILSTSITAQTNVKCKGNSTGSATVTAAGGTPVYSYLWNSVPAQNTATASNLPAGVYTVTVTDANLCTSTVSATITEPAVILSTSITAQTNVKCKGNSTGSATVTAAGGTPVYSYLWNSVPAQNTATASNLPAGVYTVTVTDANLCTSTVSSTITEPAAILSTSITAQTNVKCKGNSTGSATVTAAGGTPVYSYLWNSVPVQNTATASNLPAGIYTVTVTDANLCTSTVSATITEPAAVLSSSITAQTNVKCKGNSTGSATVTAAGGTPVYSYLWNSVPAQNTATASNLPAGIYTVTVTDANLCTSTVSATITEPAAILSTSITAQTNVKCKGNSTGSATVTAAGGTPVYSYLWNSVPAQNTATASNLPAGVYTVTVTDANLCTSTVSATITEPAAILSSSITAQTNVSCNGGNNGSATVTAAGGTPAYSYLWNTVPAQITLTASNLIAGTYSVTVTDINNCTSISGVTITQPNVLNVSIAAQTNVSCNGGNNGSVTASVSGGTTPYSFLWSNAQTTNPAINLTAGVYGLTVTDNKGCTSTSSATITEPVVLTSAVSSQTNISCNGGSNGAVTLNIAGGTSPYTYLWSNSQTTNPATYLSAGVHSCTTTDSKGCTTVSSATITQPSILNSSISAQSNVSCNAGNNGSVTLSVSGGTTPYSYLWSNAQTTNPATNLIAGVYTCTISDANLCQKTVSTTITQPAIISVSISSQVNVSCKNGTNGSVTLSISGGTAPYSYLWSNAQTTNPATNLVAGVYACTVTDNNGCTSVKGATITEPNELLASVSSQTNVSCNGGNTGSVTLSVSGGTTPYSYLWSNAQTTNPATSLSAGVYTCTITDNKSCSKTVSATITQPTVLSVSVSGQTNVSCFGGSDGSITVSVSGGVSPYAYSWTGGQTTNPAINLTSGTYTVTVTDANSCKKNTSATLSQPTNIVLSVASQTNVSCNGGNNGSITLSNSGGTPPYTYLWSNAQITNPAVNLVAGSYTVTLTDNKGCTKTTSATITQPVVLSTSLSSQTNVGCNGENTGAATISVSGGTAPYTYLWNDGQTTNPAIGLIAGVYSCTVTDNKGCTSISSVTITEADALSVVSSFNSATCGSSNGDASVVISGGTNPYSYSWSTGGTNSSINGIPAGSYSVTITDASLCTISENINVDNIGSPTASISASSNVTCNGGNDGDATVSAIGGTTPYTYLWSDGQSLDNATSLIAGIYSVTVTDANTCISSVNVTITQPNPLNANISAKTNVSCNGGSNGSATVLASGGVPAYSFSWNTTPVQNTQTASNLSAGVYTVTVSQSSGCIATAIVNVTITEPVLLSSSISAQINVSCNGGNNGSATVLPSGGTSPYTYLWDNPAPAQTLSTANSLLAGTYNVTVTDSKGCTSTSQAVITEPSLLTSAISLQNNVSCFGGNNGDATVTPNGGTSPFTYNWSDGQNNVMASNLIAGIYSVTTTDFNNCQTITEATITEPTELTSSITAQTDVVCKGLSTGSATVSANGGTSPYTYLWSDNQTTNTAVNLAAGNYSVTITDSNNCESSTSVTITEPDIVLASSISAQTNASCFGKNDGDATVQSTGGDLPYTYSWSTIPEQTTQQAINLSDGIYSVTVVDANGCNNSVATVTITEPSQISIALLSQTNVSCNGGNDGLAELSVSGGTSPYSYLWSDNQITNPAISLNQGSYDVTVFDNNSCSETFNVNIIEPTLLTSSITSQTNVLCNGSNTGELTVTPNGGTSPYTYFWIGGQSSQSVSNLLAGTYNVTISDNKNCNSISSATVTQPAIINVSKVVTNVKCNGGTTGEINITVSGGVSPYSFSWSNSSILEDVSGLSAGVYTVTVTDANNCKKVNTTTITQPINPISIIFNKTDVSCFGGSDGTATASVSGGTNPYSYLWDSGEITQTITNKISGDYNVTITDFNLCTFSSLVTINQPSELSLSIQSQTDVVCNGESNGTAEISVSGGTSPYSYNWFDGNTLNINNNLNVGTHTVTVSDNNSCSKTIDIIINEPTLLSLTLSSQTNVDCYGNDTGSSEVSASGGVSPYTFLWSDGQINQVANNLIAGIYSVTTTDNNLCETSITLTVTEPQMLILTIDSKTNISCNGGNDGQISISTTGGQFPYSYLWSSGQTIDDISSLVAGNYIVTITDANNCSIDSVIQISEPAVLTSSISSTNVTCNNGSDGSATLTVSGGTNPYTYLWSNAESSIDIYNLSSGIYTATTTDANNCTSISSVDITQPAPMSPNAGNDTTVCSGSLVTYIATGGDDYIWSDGINQGIPYSVTNSGWYYVTVTTLLGCSDNDSLYVTILQLPNVNAGDDKYICPGDNIQIGGSPTISGGLSPYNIEWNNSSSLDFDNITNPIASPTSNTNYSITVTDANNCVNIDDVNVFFNSLAIVDAGLNDTICEGEFYTLNGSFGGSATSISWTSSSGGDFDNFTSPTATYTPTIADINNGFAILTITTNDPPGDCEAISDSVRITIYGKPYANAGSDDIICSENTASLNGNYGGSANSFYWSATNGIFADSLNTITTYSPSYEDIQSGGLYIYLTTNDTSGYCQIGKDSLYLTINPIPEVFAGNDTSICEGEQIQLNATYSGSTTSVIWTSLSDGTWINENQTNAIYTPSATDVSNGSIVLVITSDDPAGPCIAVSDTIIVNIEQAATVFAGNDIQICPNASLLLSEANYGGSASSINWTTSGNGLFDNSTDVNTTYNPSIDDINNGEVSLYLATNDPAGVCMSVNDTIIVSITGVVQVSTIEDFVVCANTPSVNVSGQITGPTTTGKWTTSGDGTFTSETALNTFYNIGQNDTINNSVTLYLTSDDVGLCDQVTDSIVLTINPGIYVNAGLDTTVCANNSTVQLAGNVWGNTTNTGKWSTSGDGIFSPNDSLLTASYIPGIQDTINGGLTLYLVSTNNDLCDAVTDSLIITITPAPGVDAGNDIFVCVNNPTISLSGNVFGGASTGEWATNGSGIFADESSLITTYEPTEQDTLNGNIYFVLSATSYGTCNQVSDTLYTYFTPAPIVNAGEDFTICSNDSAEIFATIVGGAGTGVWSKYNCTGNILPSNTSLNITYVPSSSDITNGFATLVLSTTNLQGCSVVTDTIIINITNKPDVFAGDTIEVCENNSLVTLNGIVSGPTTTGIWETLGDGSFNFSTDQLNNEYIPGLSDISNGQVELILKSTNNGFCSEVVDTVIIDILPKPIVNAGLDKIICKSLNANLNGQVSGATTIGTWSTLGDGSFVDLNSLNTSYIPGTNDTTQGFVNLILTSSNNQACIEVTDTIRLTFIDIPYVYAGQDQTICNNNSTITLNGDINSPTNSVLWETTGSGIFIPDNVSINAQYITSPADTVLGSISLILHATNSCIISDTLSIDYTLTPIVDAGINRTICIDQQQVQLNGIVNGGTTTGIWSSSGTGYFIPDNTTLNAKYVRSPQDSINGVFYLTLKATNADHCLEVKDSIRIKITTIPVVNAGNDYTYCSNNANIHLGGIVSGGASTGIWTTNGTGTFSPSNTNLTGFYYPSSVDTANGFVLLTLTSTNACIDIVDSVRYTFTPAPYVNAGSDLSVCANNNVANLSGYISSNSNTGKWFTSGTGTFNPNNTTLNSQYNPSTLDVSNGGCYLTLVSTNNGMCFAVRDTIRVNITPAPVVNAGQQQYVCKDATIQLNGSITGGATSGLWTSSGTGTFSPSNAVLNPVYTPTPADTLAGLLTFTLTTTDHGNCNEVSSAMVAVFTDKPTVNAGIDKTLCANNANLVLNGIVSGTSTTGIWSTTGTGSFVPNATNLNATFKPSVSTIQSGSIQLILSSTNSCVQTDTILLTFTNAPLVNAGTDQVFCVNNPIIELNGSVTLGASSGIWTSTGTGTFSPNDTTLNATYYPSDNDTSLSQITLTLMSTNHGNCNNVTDPLTVYFVDKPIVYAGEDQIVCANTMVLFDGNITGGITEGYWQTTGNGTFYSDSSDIYGYYRFSSQDTSLSELPFILSTPEYNGCASESDTMNVQITPAPFVYAGLDTTVCANNSEIQLNGNIWGATNTGKWTTSGDGIFIPNDSTLNAIYTPGNIDINAGYANLVLTSTNYGDCAFVRDTLKLTILPSPVTNAGQDQYVCNGSNVYIRGHVTGGSTSGIWSTNGTGTITPDNTSLDIVYIPSAQDTIDGTIYFVLSATDIGTCNPVFDTVYVHFTEPPFVDAGSDFTVCANNSEIELQGIVSGSTTSGKWTTSGDGIFSPDSTSLNGTYIPGQNDILNGNAVLTLSSTYACLIKDSINITVTPAPIVNAGLDLILCVDEMSIDILGTVSGGANTGVWSTSGTGTFSPNDSSLIANYNISEEDSINMGFNIILTSTNNGNCLAVSDTMNVSITTVPVVSAGDDQIVCANVNAQLAGSIIGGNNTIQWTTSGSGTFFPSDTSINANYIFSAADTTIGEVNLTIVSTNACVTIFDEMHIDITPAPFLEIWVDNPACENNESVQLYSSFTVAGGVEWASSTNGTFIPDNNTQNPLYMLTSDDIANGTISLTLTSINNGDCNPVVVTYDLPIVPKPIVNAGNNQNVCFENLFVNLNGSVTGGSTTGIWTTNGSGTFVPNNETLNAIYVPSVMDTIASQNGIYFVLTSTFNGTCIEEVDTMYVVWTEKPEVFAGDDIAICSYNSVVQLNGQVVGPNNTGYWSTNGTGTFSPDSTTLNATYIPSQEDFINEEVILTLTSTNSCVPVSDDLILYLNGIAGLDFNTSVLCNNTTATFNNLMPIETSANYTWQWTFGDGNSSTDRNPVHSYSSISNYQVQLIGTSENSCSDTIVKTVSLHGIDASYIATAKCLNDAVIFNDNSSVQNDTIISWLWDFGDGNSSTNQNTSHVYSAISTYDTWLYVTSASGCRDSVSNSVEIYPYPTADFSIYPDKPHPYEAISFNDLSIGANNWLWIFGEIDSSNVQNPAHTFYVMNTYSVTQIVTNEYGCKDSITVDVLVEGLVEPFIPSAFTPNNDGQNDVLRVRGGPFTSVEMQVYNSWGKLIFESNNQSIGWDGSYKGKQQAIGVYIYIVKAVTIDGIVHYRQGDVTLLR